MKAGSYFALLLLVFSFSGVAHADPVPNDFQFQVLDPGNEATLNYLDFQRYFLPWLLLSSSCPGLRSATWRRPVRLLPRLQQQRLHLQLDQSCVPEQRRRRLER
jgi:hypothetical protein